MQIFAKIRFAAAPGLAFCVAMAAQTPAVKPSAAASALPSAQTTQSSLPASQQAAHAAEVTYTDGKLFVAADNSSLNQILREIARETGMKITGAVSDERVFGQYGPAAPAQILGTLLDGTGSNMLLLQATAATPAELILTPRSGGPSPPNPNASASDSEEDTVPPPTRPQFVPTTGPEATAPSNPAGTQPAQQSPNAPKTPQQIFEQLQRMRQQQQQQQSNPH